MAEKINEPMMLVLHRGSDGRRVTVSLDSFLRFNSEMDYDLEMLVNRWADYMTAASCTIAQQNR